MTCHTELQHRKERGITGLETAIILIAFVVVASVFSYSVLSAGIFSSEKGKEAVHQGLETVRSSMTLAGGVTVRDTDADNDVDWIVFTLSNALRGEGIDMHITTDTDGDGVLDDEASKNHTTVISYIDQYQRLGDIAWTKSQVGKSDGDDVLEPGEKFEITVYLSGLATAYPVVAYSKFVLEVKPDAGAPLVFERTMPPVVDTFTALH